METGPLAELGRKILADLARTSLTSALAGQAGKTSSTTRRSKSVLPMGDDLPSYLRTIHRWLTTAEVAALLHCHTETIYRRIKSNGLPAHRDSGRWKFDPGKIGQWIEGRDRAWVEEQTQDQR